MLIYGICMSEIKDSEIDWDKVEKLLESYDSSLHRDFKEYVNYDDSETQEELEYWKKEWFLAYDSMGYHGLGAFLHDVIKKEEDIDLDMGDSNGFILGIANSLPFDKLLERMVELEGIFHIIHFQCQTITNNLQH